MLKRVEQTELNRRATAASIEKDCGNFTMAHWDHCICGHAIRVMKDCAMMYDPEAFAADACRFLGFPEWDKNRGNEHPFGMSFTAKEAAKYLREYENV